MLSLGFEVAEIVQITTVHTIKTKTIGFRRGDDFDEIIIFMKRVYRNFNPWQNRRFFFSH